MDTRRNAVRFAKEARRARAMERAMEGSEGRSGYPWRLIYLLRNWGRGNERSFRDIQNDFLREKGRNGDQNGGAVLVTGAPVIVGWVGCGISIRRSMAMFTSGNAFIESH